jgi:hypothetical protein
MRYSPDAQRIRLEEVIDNDLKQLPCKEQLDYLTAAIRELAFEFKNPAFIDEREWRLTCSTFEDAPGHQLLFVPRADIIKPYLDTSSLKTVATLLPIRSVLCGPKLEPRMALEATRQFLTSNGYGDVDVQTSELSKIWQ